MQEKDRVVLRNSVGDLFEVPNVLNLPLDLSRGYRKLVDKLNKIQVEKPNNPNEATQEYMELVISYDDERYEWLKSFGEHFEGWDKFFKSMSQKDVEMMIAKLVRSQSAIDPNEILDKTDLDFLAQR